MPDRLIAGAMSGTSADGVDVAIVRIAGRGIGMTAQLLHHHHVPYSAAVRAAIFSTRERGAASLEQLATLCREISLCYSRAVNEAAKGFERIDAIAAHGQTLFHAPPNTIQWLDPALLAAETNCCVISDFRRADCAAGGQGAPLVPFADYVLFRHATTTRVLLNIGGIANLTYLPAGGNIDRLIAFDTGPGNCICDALVRSAMEYDVGGKIAARGVVLEQVLNRAMSDDFFKQSPPKSTDGPAMIKLFQSAKVGEHRIEDLLHTACALTARTIADAIRNFCPSPPEELIVSGGGVENATLMGMLKALLPGIIVLTTEAMGTPASAKEAVAFALLGAATLDGEPANVPSCTGARHPVILGSITLKPVKTK